MKKILIICLVCALLFSCKKDDKAVKKFYNNNVEETISFKRFDRALFSAPKTTLEEHLKDLQKEYPYMFQQPLSDKEYLSMLIQMVSDTQMQKAQNI
ncbi:MAG: hypothetical protein VZQ58_05085, partial [Bacteroidales bacterium]|nr:hypothetical protein [Bacteroidales bacterium]